MPFYGGTRFALRTQPAAAAAAVDYYAALQALTPAILFAPGVAGSCFQERTGASATTPSTNGDVVGSLKNQGSLGGWATALADAGRPILRVSGGLTYLEFDGTDDALDFVTDGTAMFQNVGAGMLASSHRWRSSPTSAELVWYQSTPSSSQRAGIGGGATSGKHHSGGRRLDADSNANFSSSASVSTVTPATQIAEFDWTNSNLTQYINNSIDGSTTSFQTDGSTSNTASATVRLGSAQATAYADIDVYGFTAKAALMDRATVHAWLASVAGI